jgi:hypothetical protein
MKYLTHFFLAVLVTLSFSSCAAPAGGGHGAEAQLGPHSGQKFALVHRRVGARDTDPQGSHLIAIVVKVVQKEVNGEQEIVASASAHSDGPGGALVNVDAINIHVLQPSDFKTEPKKTGEAQITKSIPMQGGKFRTVVAEAVATSTEFPDTTVSITIPGD